MFTSYITKMKFGQRNCQVIWTAQVIFMKTWSRYRPLWYIQISILYEPELTPAPGRYLGELWAVAIVLSASITTLVMPYWPWRGSGRAMMGLGVGRALVKLTARKHSHTRGRRQRHGHRHLTSEEPVWDDILTPLYIDPGVNISYDILTPGSIYRNDILTPLTIFWPPLPIVHKTVLLVMTNC